MAPTIANAVSDCMNRAECAVHALQSYPTICFRAENNQQRLQEWCRSTNVFDESKMTLDRRIGDADDIRSLFIQLLRVVIPFSNPVEYLAERAAKPRRMSGSSTSSTEEEKGISLISTEPSDKTDKHVLAIERRLLAMVKKDRDLIARLQRLSNSVRAVSSVERAARVDAWWSDILDKCEIEDEYAIFSQVQDSHRNLLDNTSLFCAGNNQQESLLQARARNHFLDLLSFRRLAERFVTQEFPNCEMWLRQRLVESMCFRRKRCMYLSTRPAINAKESLIAPPAVDANESLRPTAPPDKPSISVPNTIMQSSPRPVKDIGPATANADPPPATFSRKDWKAPPSTYSISTTPSSAHDNSLELPPCPGNPFTDDDFECPYCKFILPSTQALPRRWKRHVLQDLEPYVCIREDCPEANKIFSTSQDWRSHLQGRYHGLRWMCRIRDHDPKSFTTEEQYLIHLQNDHKQTLEPAMLRLLARTNQVEESETFSMCPLCGFHDTPSTDDVTDQIRLRDSDRVENDIIRHLRRLATLSLVVDDSFGDYWDQPTESARSVSSGSPSQLSHRRPKSDEAEGSLAPRMTEDLYHEWDQHDSLHTVSTAMFDVDESVPDVFSNIIEFNSDSLPISQLRGDMSLRPSLEQVSMRRILESLPIFSWPGRAGEQDHTAIYNFQTTAGIDEIFKRDSQLPRDLYQHKLGRRLEVTECHVSERVPELMAVKCSFAIVKCWAFDREAEPRPLLHDFKYTQELKHPHISLVLGCFTIGKSEEFVRNPLFGWLEVPVRHCSFDDYLWHVSRKLITGKPINGNYASDRFASHQLANESLTTKMKHLQRYFVCLSEALAFLHQRDLPVLAAKWMDGVAVSIDNDGEVILSLAPMVFDAAAPPNVHTMSHKASSVLWLGVIFLRMATLLMGRNLGQFDAFVQHELFQLKKSREAKDKEDFELGLTGIGTWITDDPDTRPHLLWIQSLKQDVPKRKAAWRELLHLRVAEFEEAVDCIHDMLLPDYRERPETSGLWEHFNFSNIEGCRNCHPNHFNKY